MLDWTNASTIPTDIKNVSYSNHYIHQKPKVRLSACPITALWTFWAVSRHLLFLVTCFAVRLRRVTSHSWHFRIPPHCCPLVVAAVLKKLQFLLCRKSRPDFSKANPCFDWICWMVYTLWSNGQAIQMDRVQIRPGISEGYTRCSMAYCEKEAGVIDTWNGCRFKRVLWMHSWP